FTGRFAYQPLTSNTKFEPDFFLVNGLVTPFKKVDRTCYRLRILNGSNARFFQLAFRTEEGGISTKEWRVIGVDGGFLTTPVETPTPQVGANRKQMVVLTPAERLDVIADFSQFPAGTNVELAYLRSNGTFLRPVMQFQVQATTAPSPSGVRAAGRSPRLASPYSLPADGGPHPHHAPSTSLTRTRTIGLDL